MVNKFLTLALFLTLLVGCGSHNKHSENSVNPQNRTVLNGTKAGPEQGQFFGPVLRMVIGNKSSCSSSYLGNGYILTAYHCIGSTIAETGSKPDLAFSSPKNPGSSNNVSEEDYEVSYPPAEKWEVTKSGDTEHKIQQPDLAMIKLKPHVSTRFANVGTAIVAGFVMEPTLSKPYIAGYGRTNMPNMGENVSGILHYGRVFINGIDNLFYHLKTTSTEYAAGLPGDSGGPLYESGVNGKVVVHGVASTLSVKKEISSGGAVPITKTVYSNRYVKMETANVQRWLREMTSR